jgi:hypothetical protein
MLTPKITIRTDGFIEFNRLALLRLGNGANKLCLYKSGNNYHLMEADEEFMESYNTDYYQVTRMKSGVGIVVNNSNINTIGILLDLKFPLKDTTFKLIKSKFGKRKSFRIDESNTKQKA